MRRKVLLEQPDERCGIAFEGLLGSSEGIEESVNFLRAHGCRTSLRRGQQPAPNQWVQQATASLVAVAGLADPGLVT
jgi:hypothetical protein